MNNGTLHEKISTKWNTAKKVSKDMANEIARAG